MEMYPNIRLRISEEVNFAPAYLPSATFDVNNDKILCKIRFPFPFALWRSNDCEFLFSTCSEGLFEK